MFISIEEIDRFIKEDIPYIDLTSLYSAKPVDIGVKIKVLYN